ncbi:zf-HC2 domain-containing protein [Streptomyces sp. NBC_00038]|uniref:zf-HC2 domain-containing protein n=1 Tax=Streptomyces sp. NBC_00038 TaxID=2903615 RepID=UPI00225409E1|nr:zf-HC2 domain-containing protein [Streptomyces sp. NBC_00038]MCX5560694.1 zf-HC2 domain-containing protein [Streptomyces sp. NBC_00038]
MTDHSPPIRDLPRLRPAPRTDDRHLPTSWVADYARGELAVDLLAHAEAHLGSCRPCGEAVNSAVRQGPYGARLDALHGSLLDRLGGPPPGDPPARSPRGWSWRPPWLSAVHGLRLPWLLAVVAVCGAGTWLAHVDQSPQALPGLLLLAPLLPLLCVAASYGGRADPFAEVTRTTPAGGLRLLLIRTGQVLLLCVPLLTVATFTLSRMQPTRGTPLDVSAAGWLLPCLTLTLTTLLVSSYLGSRLAALLTSGGWLLAAATLAHLSNEKHAVENLDAGELTEALNHLLGDSRQAIWAVTATVVAELLVLRRHAFSRPGTRGTR